MMNDYLLSILLVSGKNHAKRLIEKRYNNFYS
jgi:hypothetical protein